MKKHYTLGLLAVALLSACSNPKAIEFSVATPGISNAVFVVKDQGRQTLFGENIKDGKCDVKGMLEQPGFYLMDIVKDNDKEHLPFEVYLEPGKYTVTTEGGDLQRYPKIETDSKKQQEINNYNAIYQQLGGAATEQKIRLNSELEAKSRSLSKEAYKLLLIKIADAEAKEHNLQYQALEQYIKKYPESELAAHFMSKQNYADNPESYLKLYKQLSPAAKNSDDGKELSKSLQIVGQLQPGKKAPEIAGKTFDGKPFSSITAGKKLF